MTDDVPVLLSARLSASTSYLLVRDHPDWLREIEAKGRNLVLAGSERTGREALRDVEEIRAAAKAFQRLALPEISARGNAEVPHELEPAGLEVSSYSPRPGLTSQVVADQLGLTPKQVTNLVKRGRLVGHQAGRGKQWFIDEVSVAEELDRRGRA